MGVWEFVAGVALLVIGWGLSEFGQMRAAKRETERRAEDRAERHRDRLDRYRADAADAVMAASGALSAMNVFLAAAEHGDSQRLHDSTDDLMRSGGRARMALAKIHLNHPDEAVSERAGEVASVLQESVYRVMMEDFVERTIARTGEQRVSGIDVRGDYARLRAEVKALGDAVRATARPDPEPEG